MTQQYLLKIQPTSPLHIGLLGGNTEDCAGYIPSDTLLGALCSSWALLYGRQDLENLLNQFNSNSTPPFILTSAFPHVIEKSGSDEKDYFFLPQPPMPLDRAGLSEIESEVLRERLKELEWDGLKLTPLACFNRQISSGRILSHDPNKAEEDMRTLQRAGDALGHSIEKDLLPKVTIDRVTSKSLLHFLRIVKFLVTLRKTFAFTFPFTVLLCLELVH